MTSRILLALCVFAILACSSSGGGGGGGSSTTSFRVRPFEEKVFSNGLRVLFIPDQSLPKIGMSLMVKAGSAHDPKDLEGVTSLMVNLLEAGTSKRTALQLADDVEQLGARLDESVAQDYSLVSITGLTTTKEKLLEIFTDVVTNPAFDAKELERNRSEALAALTKMVDNPSGYADLMLDKELFGTHPYGRPSIGNPKSVSEITRTQIIRQYFEHVRPGNSMLAVYGQFDNNFKKQIEEAFSKWGAGDASKTVTPIPQQATSSAAIVLHSKAGLSQTQIRMGHLGIARNDADFLKLRLANVVLGGTFASRLNQKVRDDLGLTYSIHSQMDARKLPGTFEISTFSRNDKVGETVSAAMEVYRTFVKEGVKESELNAAKALLSGQFPAAIETVDRLAFNLLYLRLNGVSDDYLNRFFKNVDAVKVSDVNQTIQKHFTNQKLMVVVYADASKVKSQLDKIGTVQVIK